MHHFIVSFINIQYLTALASEDTKTKCPKRSLPEKACNYA